MSYYVAGIMLKEEDWPLTSVIEYGRVKTFKHLDFKFLSKITGLFTQGTKDA
jgi:hypothetical protein